MSIASHHNHYDFRAAKNIALSPYGYWPKQSSRRRFRDILRLSFFRLALVAGFFFILFTSKAFASEPSEQILVYVAPQAQKILEKLPANEALIPIYRKGDWLKVGNPRNGQVGWVNQKQMQKAREAFFRPDIQTVYIHTDKNAKGKPQVNIVAYKNGKKLSPQEAKRLYQHIRKEQVAQMKEMQRSISFDPFPGPFIPTMTMLPPTIEEVAIVEPEKEPKADN